MTDVAKVTIVLPAFELKVRVPRLPSFQSFSSTRHCLSSVSAPRRARESL